MRAYALMRHPAELEATYSGSPFYARARTEIETIRAAGPKHLPTSYRGIGRYPFTEHSEKGPGWQWGGETPSPDDNEAQARALMLNFLGPHDYETAWPRAFLSDVQSARRVYAALSAAQDYELVELCTSPDMPRDLLGFDVGYWGGGNFSILCDTAIWPLWHPPAQEALGDAALVLRDLNDYGLFPSDTSAKAYLDWYAKQPWAESEPSEFHVIAVGTLPPLAG